MNSAVGTIWWSSSSGSAPTGPPAGTAVDGGWLLGSGYSGNQTTYYTYGKMSSFNKPGPANTFVIIDENPFSINDASFAAAAATTGNPANGGYLVDFPGANHNLAAGISFCDGHSIIHKWLNPLTYTPSGIVQPGMGSQTSTVSTPNMDCVYLASIASAAK